MKRTLILLALLSICLSASKHENKPNPRSKVKRIEVTAVDFHMKSFASVDCESFYSMLKKHYIDTVIPKGQIAEFMALLENQSIDSNPREIDTRAKVIIYKKRKESDTLCIGMGGMLYNNIYYDQNLPLINYLQNLIGL